MEAARSRTLGFPAHPHPWAHPRPRGVPAAKARALSTIFAASAHISEDLEETQQQESLATF